MKELTLGRMVQSPTFLRAAAMLGAAMTGVGARAREAVIVKQLARRILALRDTQEHAAGVGVVAQGQGHVLLPTGEGLEKSERLRRLAQCLPRLTAALKLTTAAMMRRSGKLPSVKMLCSC